MTEIDFKINNDNMELYFGNMDEYKIASKMFNSIGMRELAGCDEMPLHMEWIINEPFPHKFYREKLLIVFLYRNKEMIKRLFEMLKQNGYELHNIKNNEKDPLLINFKNTHNEKTTVYDIFKKYINGIKIKTKINIKHVKNNKT